MKGIIRKITILILVAACFLNIAACGKDNNENPTEKLSGKIETKVEIVDGKVIINGMEILTDSSVYKTTVKTNPLKVDRIYFDCFDDNEMPIGGFYGPFDRDPSRESDANVIDGVEIPNFLTDKYYQYMKDAGINLIYATGKYYGQSGFEKTLDLASKYGMGVYALHTEIFHLLPTSAFNGGVINDDNRVPSITGAQMEQMVSAYKDHPALAGWYLHDEPFVDQGPAIAKVMDVFYNEANFKNKHLGFCMVGHDSSNRFGGASYQEELDSFLQAGTAKYITFDCYIWDDACNYNYESPAYERYMKVLSTTYNTARESEIPFWVMMQAGGEWARGSEDIPLNREFHVTESQFMWNYNTAISYGAKGMMFFPLFQPYNFTEEYNGRNYDASGIFGADGGLNQWYFYAKKANKQIRAAQNVLMNAQSVGIIASGTSTERWTIKRDPNDDYRFGYFSEVFDKDEFRELKSVEGDALIGCFDYKGGTALYVTNFSMTDKQMIKLNFDDRYAYDIIQRGEEVSVAAETVSLILEAGEGALVVLR